MSEAASSARLALFEFSSIQSKNSIRYRQIVFLASLLHVHNVVALQSEMRATWDRVEYARILIRPRQNEQAYSWWRCTTIRSTATSKCVSNKYSGSAPVLRSLRIDNIHPRGSPDGAVRAADCRKKHHSGAFTLADSRTVNIPVQTAAVVWPRPHLPLHHHLFRPKTAEGFSTRVALRAQYESSLPMLGFASGCDTPTGRSVRDMRRG